MWRTCALFSLLLLLVAAPARAQVECDVTPTACQQQTQETVEPPPIKFDFEIKIKPGQKPKQKAQPKTQKPSKQIRTTTRRVLRTRTVIIQKRFEKPAPRPAPQRAAIPSPKKPIAQRAKVEDASWIGLPEVPVSSLLARDLEDIAGQVIVDLNPAAFTAAGLDIQTITIPDLATRLGIAPNQIRSIQRRFMLTAVITASPAEAAALAANPLIASLVNDTQIKAAASKLKLSWGLDRLDSPTLPLDRSFDRQEGDYQARIYLFDTAVDPSSREFEKRIATGASFVAPPKDKTIKCREHGTEMASLLAGQNTGAAPKAEIIELVVLPCERQRTGEGASLIEAAEWLLIREADLNDSKPILANMSLAGKWSKAINKAVSVLSQNGVVVIAAAGNNAQDACRFSPAAAKEAITVAATDPKDEQAAFSNFGKCVDIFAPGRLLTALTEGDKDQYVTINGTSGAAAMVTGLLARSINARGGEAAQTWLASAALPAKFWSKTNSDALMMQVNNDWRKLCRLESETSLFEKPNNKSKARTLSANTLLSAETDGEWIKATLSNGVVGWLSQTKLLKADQVVPCEQAL